MIFETGTEGYWIIWQLFQSKEEHDLWTHIFQQMSQLSGKPVDHFISEVHTLAESYEFGEMKEKLICDQLVVGI